MKPYAFGWLVLATCFAQAQPEPISPPSEEPEAPRSDYAGPAILSRGLSALIRPDRELLRLRPYASVRATYDTGLAAFSLDEAGRLREDASFGVTADFGITGYHAWRRSVLGMQYRGRLRHYTRRSYYDGFDNFYTLHLTHRLSRRVTVQVSPSIASFSRGFFMPETGSAFYSSELAALTDSELFDSRVNAVTGSGRLVYQRTARLSFSLGGNGFTARRHSAALVGVTGYSASGDVAYRVSRYQTVGVDYKFMHYDFQRVFGDTDANGIGLNYSAQMGRNWTLSLRVGGYRVEFSRLQRVPLDPVIAAIVGQRAAITTNFRKFYHPEFQGNLTRRYRRGAVSLHYTRTISPGNGLYLAGSMERGGVSTHYQGTRRASFHAYASAYQQRALVQDLSKYRGIWGGVGMHYRLGHDLGLTADAGVRRFRSANGQLDRWARQVSVGLTYSPGERPFSLW